MKDTIRILANYALRVANYSEPVVHAMAHSASNQQNCGLLCHHWPTSLTKQEHLTDFPWPHTNAFKLVDLGWPTSLLQLPQDYLTVFSSTVSGLILKEYFPPTLSDKSANFDHFFKKVSRILKTDLPDIVVSSWLQTGIWIRVDSHHAEISEILWINSVKNSFHTFNDKW